jgi:hypothetical protein
VISARAVDIHGDRYVDVALQLDDVPGQPVSGRVGASECPPDLGAGESVEAHFTMGVITRIARTRD